MEDDGLVFLPETVHGAQIREGQRYSGIRVNLTAMLGKARSPLQIDIGFGDGVTLLPELVAFPTILALPAPRLRAYPRESVIAE